MSDTAVAIEFYGNAQALGPCWCPRSHYIWERCWSERPVLPPRTMVTSRPCCCPEPCQALWSYWYIWSVSITRGRKNSSENLVIIVYQKPEALNQTSDMLQWAIPRKHDWTKCYTIWNTEVPNATNEEVRTVGMKRLERFWGYFCFVLVFNWWFILLWFLKYFGDALQVWEEAMGGLECESWGEWCETPKESIDTLNYPPKCNYVKFPILSSLQIPLHLLFQINDFIFH